LEASDEQLYADYLAGDATAFARLYGRYRQPLFGFLRNSGLARAECEDLYQDIWLGIAQFERRFHGGNFRAWLYQVTRNRAVDVRRRARVRDAASLDRVADPPAQTPPPERQADGADCVQRLVAGIAGLPEAQREAFLLREETGLDLATIARIVDAGVETVKSRLRYAMRKLRAQLEDCL
jgi:RNA polymerase sigma-70 factor (ECF subfamily)